MNDISTGADKSSYNPSKFANDVPSTVPPFVDPKDIQNSDSIDKHFDGSFDTNPIVMQADSDRTHMTKLEFYYEIKNHFTGSRDDMFGSAPAARARSSLAHKHLLKLVDCIKAASASTEPATTPSSLLPPG
ncbi:hypothetical protein Gpo141_00010211 [Globisporangium polare]